MSSHPPHADSSSRDAAANSGKAHHHHHHDSSAADSEKKQHSSHKHDKHAADERSKRHRHSSRSRSRSRDREKDRKHSSKHSHRDRSRSRSRSRSRDKKSKRDKEKSDDKHGKDKSASGSTREIERALRKAQKLLKAGGDASAIAAAGLDPSLIDALIAQQKAAVASAAAADNSKDRSAKDERKKKSKKRKADSSSDSSSDASSSSSDEDAGVSLLLSDGVTPRLFKRDYFSRSTEFRLWLRETTGNSIDKMASKKAHKLFGKFIDAWNARKLDAKYYKGLDASALGAAALTAHKWSFSKGLSESERSKIDAVRDEIDSATHHHSYAQEFQGKQTSAQEARAQIEAVSAAAIARKKEQSLHPERMPAAAAAGSSASAAGPATRPTETYDERQARIAREKIENKRLSIRQAAVLEELAPKPTGREAVIDARRTKGAYARADRSGGDGLGEVAEAEAMGGSSAAGSAGGKGEYAAMVAQRASAAAQREQSQSQKLTAHQLKEQETMRKMLASIGQADKYPIG